MKIQEFIETLPNLYDNWGNSNVLTKSLDFANICREIEFLTGTNVMQILNLAVKCLDENEVYCEIGVGRGASFIGALSDNSEIYGYAIDDFSDLPQEEDNLAILADNLAKFGLEDQVMFVEEDFNDFFTGLKTIGIEEKIGVYYYDAKDDYRSVFMSLLLVKSFLADRALMVIHNSESHEIQQAIEDFIACEDRAKVLFDSSSLGKAIFDNGITIIAWDILGAENLPEANLLNQNWLANSDPNFEEEPITYGLFSQRDKKLVLHVGCGPYYPEALPKELRTEEWREVRLDINPAVQPDVIGTITDLSAVPDNSIDAIYSSHNLEHIYHHEVPIALKEFHRVLKPSGFALITLPDIQKIAKEVAEGNLEETLYVAPVGPIAAIDVMYGLGTAIARGNHYMAHKTAFTQQTLQDKLLQAGFATAEVYSELLNLWATAYKEEIKQQKATVAPFLETDKKIVLHVGCGPYDPEALPDELRTEEWQEVRLDIDPNVQPDVISSITDLSLIPDQSIDVIYSSHNLEHIYAHEIPIALQEFYRVLKPNGFVWLIVPDMQQIAEVVAQGKLEDTLYTMPIGDITPLDVMYGLRSAIANGQYHMAHKTGFTKDTIKDKLLTTGFDNVDIEVNLRKLKVIGYRQ